jgi:hypothetical protein
MVPRDKDIFRRQFYMECIYYMPSLVWHMSDFPLTDDESFIDKIDMNISNQPTTSITTPSTTNDNTNNSQTDIPTNKIDIMFLLQYNSHIKSKLTTVALTNLYPENAVFHFEGSTKFIDKDALIKIFKEKVASTGTTLTNCSSYDYTSATDPTYQTVITCKQYGILKKSIFKQDSFKPNTLHAIGVLNEPQHSGASTKGNSCNRKMKRVTNY